MKRYTSKRLILAVLAVLTTTMAYWDMPVGESCGRCFSQCINACNQIRMACDDRCALDCATRFPNDPAAFESCREVCNGICAAFTHDCKVICQNSKYPIPSEP